jgi:GntR family transcriptional regulator, transcriptional repressor for pyruvate dehydrogenase complex
MNTDIVRFMRPNSPQRMVMYSYQRTHFSEWKPHMSPAPEFDPPKVLPGGTLTDRVTAILTEKINSGEFRVGTRLPTEQVMSERFGVSRTVVREAISRLKSEGRVVVRQGSGMVVLPLSLAKQFHFDIDPSDSIEAVLHVTELRRGFEAEAAALAAQRRTQAQLAEITRALQAIEKATRAGLNGVEEDFAFHDAISRATGNPLYPALLEFLSQFMRGAIRVTRSNEARRSDLSHQVEHEHGAILEAIALQDASRARLAALRHLDNAANRIRCADRDFWATDGAEVAQPLMQSQAQVKVAAKRRKQET